MFPNAHLILGVTTNNRSTSLRDRLVTITSNSRGLESRPCEQSLGFMANHRHILVQDPAHAEALALVRVEVNGRHQHQMNVGVRIP
jgi:hypothetical protein